MREHYTVYFHAVEKVVTKNILIRVLMSEFLMIYYAFFTWKKKAPNHEGVVTMHKKTSAVAFHMMMIHAILIETIGLHWWLHDKSLVLSIISINLKYIFSVFFYGRNSNYEITSFGSKKRKTIYFTRT